ncbi:MAG: pseudouridine synthase [Flavobacteriales bacterium]
MKRRNSNGGRSGKNHKPKGGKPAHPDSAAIRLNRYIAQAGIASRRKADELIKAGLIQVNGEPITQMGVRVKPSDEVRYAGDVLQGAQRVYLILNKPRGFITTTDDERNRKTVMDLVRGASPYRIYPVGRLDRPTTGVLLLTNDGDLTKKLTHPKRGIKKIYHVVLHKKLANADLDSIKRGVALEEGIAQIDAIHFIPHMPRNELGITLHIGWNRLIRRIFEKLGYRVERLDRVCFGGLTKKGLKRGQWRRLSQVEVGYLKMLR